MTKTAIISVWEKDKAVEFARGLSKAGWKLVSTGGTAVMLRKAGLQVTDAADVTGFPEILEGRVKTLHPKIFGGILAKDSNSHRDETARHGIERFGLVCVDMYPFEDALAKRLSDEEKLDCIDVGGASMLRAAAKNYPRVIPVCDAADYDAVLETLRTSGDIDLNGRRRLAAKAFEKLSYYDAVISRYLANAAPELSDRMIIPLRRKETLRYGENPHQAAVLYTGVGDSGPGVAYGKQLQGKHLSFNNYLDMDAAWGLVCEFDQPACVIVKHTNPCGAASAGSLVDAWNAALDCDPVSAYGGIVAFNRELDDAAAEKMAGMFLECVVAPEFSKQALARLSRKQNLRIVVVPGGRAWMDGINFRQISGGILAQEANRSVFEQDPKVATRRTPTADERTAMEFALRVCKHVKSNAIVLALGTRTVGIGPGQTSRVDSLRMAISKIKSREKILKDDKPLVMASDGFVSFRDVIDEAAVAGVSAIIQPGGSIKDVEVIEAADKRGLAMLITGTRHFLH